MKSAITGAFRGENEHLCGDGGYCTKTVFFQALSLLSFILYQTHKDNETKWRKLSRDIVDVLLPLLGKYQVWPFFVVLVTMANRL